jgi:hypothetical protein
MRGWMGEQGEWLWLPLSLNKYMYGELGKDEQYLVFCIGYNVSTVFFIRIYKKRF